MPDRVQKKECVSEHANH